MGRKGRRGKGTRGPGRNDPCPCGSGRKSKRCCGPATVDAEALRALDHQCVEDILHAGAEEFGHQVMLSWLEDVPGDVDDPNYAQLHMPYVAYHAVVEGRRLIDWYLETRGERLGADVRAWLTSQQQAWLSVWEVLDVKEGAGLELRSVLTGEQRYVHEPAASRSVAVHQQLCGRVVDHGGSSLLCGMHPCALELSAAAKAVEAFHEERGGDPAEPVTAEGLRGQDSLALLDAWEDEVQALSQAR